MDDPRFGPGAGGAGREPEDPEAQRRPVEIVTAIGGVVIVLLAVVAPLVLGEESLGAVWAAIGVVVVVFGVVTHLMRPTCPECGARTGEPRPDRSGDRCGRCGAGAGSIG